MFKTPQVAALTGATLKELDYWNRIALVRPSIDLGRGAGNHRLYSSDDVRLLRAIVVLRDNGVSLNTIGRSVIDVLRDPFHDWHGWLVVTSRTAHVVTDPYAVVDLLTVEGATVTVLNLADVTLLAEQTVA